jgi:hypothetical protein
MKTIRFIQLLAVVLLLTIQQTWAQMPPGVHKCATVEYLVAMQNQDPTYLSRLNQLEGDIGTHARRCGLERKFSHRLDLSRPRRKLAS